MSAMDGFERYRSLVDDWDTFTYYAQLPLPTCVWTNLSRTTPSALSHNLSAEGVAHRPLPWFEAAFRVEEIGNPGTTLSYMAGHCHIQEEVSLLPVFALAPQVGDRVLDLCAAPGNKTVHAAVAIGNRGTVVANDRSAFRLNVLRTALYRMGLVNVSTTVGDAVHFPEPSVGFDHVIADVPCSCEGTSRKHPDVLRRSSRAQSASLAEMQRAILKRAVKLCRPGGQIVYSTCTYAPEENEMVVSGVLRANPELVARPISIPGFRYTPGLTDWAGTSLHPDVEHTIRVWPHHNDTGGFFVALLEKRG